MYHSATIFREYDIRGKVGSELIIEQIYDLIRALIIYAQKHVPTMQTVLVGMDGRTHSLVIRQEVVRAIIDSGLNAVIIGVCPSPVVYFGMHMHAYDLGIMITASHNTQEYNGFKICLGKDMVWGKALQEVYQLYKAGNFINASVPGVILHADITSHYILWLKNHFSLLQDSDVSVVIDCGNGTAGIVLPRLIEVMGWKGVTLLYDEIDGTYPNHEADPVVLENMLDVKDALQNKNIQWGVGLDGDCDRMAAMTKEGFLVPGDQLLALFAQCIVNSLSKAPIVFDIKSSSALIELLNRWQAVLVMSPSGHAIIRDQMKKTQAVLGGELSCHFFFADRYFGYDDGIYAFMRLVELLHTTKKTLTQLLTIIPHRYSTKEFRIACQPEFKTTMVEAIINGFVNKPGVEMITIDGVRVITPYGWAIVRPSNTQSVICIRCESESIDGLKTIKGEVITLLQPFLAIDLMTFMQP